MLSVYNSRGVPGAAQVLPSLNSVSEATSSGVKSAANPELLSFYQSILPAAAKKDQTDQASQNARRTQSVVTSFMEIAGKPKKDGQRAHLQSTDYGRPSQHYATN